MRYAIIENGIVVNVTSGEKLDPMWVLCSSEVGIGWKLKGLNFIPPDPKPEEQIQIEPPKPYIWFIDLGPFFDRFQTAKMSVLLCQDVGVKAILADVNIRKWVDLKRTDVAQALAYIGSQVPELTSQLQQDILNNPVTDEENLALRKVYFT